MFVSIHYYYLISIKCIRVQGNLESLILYGDPEAVRRICHENAVSLTMSSF